MKKAVIITGGGSGKRMGTSIPKQFIMVAGKPLIVHTIQLFTEFDKYMEIVVVLPKEYLEVWKEIKSEYLNNINITVTHGGISRFHSVKNGLNLIETDSIIGVHDAVRPLVSGEVISRCYSEAEKKGNAVPVINLTESIRRIEGNFNYSVYRGDLRIIQTPQVFIGELLKKAYNTGYLDEFTDDASVVEKLGIKINLVEGDRRNIKITTIEDLSFGEYYLKKKLKREE